MNTLVYLVVFFQFWNMHTRCTNVVVNPSVDQQVPQNSLDNVSYLCNVTTGGADNTGVQAVWEVQELQVPNISATIALFEDYGVFIRFLYPGVTELVATTRARELYGGNIAVQCIGTIPGSPPTSVSGDKLSITTYGPPGKPQSLSLVPATSNRDSLMLTWEPPSGGSEGVNIEYLLRVTGLSINLINTTELTSVTFQDDTASNECQQHTFTVAARNDAGTGPEVAINRTIPITPDLTQLDDDINITAVSLSSLIAITLIIPPASTCSREFEILNYTLISSDAAILPPVQLGNGSSFGSGVPQTVNLPGLPQDVMVDIYIEVCIAIACERSRTLPLRTSATQNASLVYFENNIQMSCIFAVNSDSPGCRFILTVGNVSEVFELLRDPADISSVTQCNQTMNQGEVYDSIIVVDIERDGGNGTLVLQLMGSSLPNASSYIETTSCLIPAPATSLSTGAIVGIVIAALVLGVALLVIVVILVIYCYVKDPLGIENEDEDQIIINLAKSRFFEFSKTCWKKKKKPLSVSDTGDKVLEDVVVSSPSSPTGVKESDVDVKLQADSATDAIHREDAPLFSSPKTEEDPKEDTKKDIILHISSDLKNVKLELNRALIKQKLKENKMNTRTMKKRGEISYHELKNLPMNCEMKVHAVKKE